MQKNKSKIERVIEGGNEVRLGDLQIGKRKLSLDISNYGGELNLELRDTGEKYNYSVDIGEKGMRFFRYSRQENRETESLQKVINEKIGIYKKGELIWRREYPEQKEGYEFFYILFNDSKD
jgi:hypothetical protein